MSSNRTPVRKRFEHDDTDSSGEKIGQIGTSIQDDSPKQKKTKNSQRHPWPSGLKVQKNNMPSRDI